MQTHRDYVEHRTQEKQIHQCDDFDRNVLATVGAEFVLKCVGEGIDDARDKGIEPTQRAR